MVNIQTVMTWIFPALYFEWSKKLVWAGDYDHYKSAHPLILQFTFNHQVQIYHD